MASTTNASRPFSLLHRFFSSRNPSQKRTGSQTVYQQSLPTRDLLQRATLCLCHASEDGEGVAALCDALQARGLRVWTLRCCPEQNQYWDHDHRKRVLLSDFLLVYVSKHLLHAAPYVRAIEEANQLWQKTQVGSLYLIPVQTDAAKLADYDAALSVDNLSNPRAIDAPYQTLHNELEQRTTSRQDALFEQEARRLEACHDLPTIAQVFRDSPLFDKLLNGQAIQAHLTTINPSDLPTLQSRLEAARNEFTEVADQTLLEFVLISSMLYDALYVNYTDKQQDLLQIIKHRLEQLIAQFAKGTTRYETRLHFVALGWLQRVMNALSTTMLP